MQNRTSRYLVGALAVFALAASPTLAAGRGASPGARSLIAVRDLEPSRGGASLLPHGYLPLHARELALAKAAANAKAGVQGAPGKGGGGKGGGAIVSTFANVSPSFNAVYQTQVTPPDTTGAVGPDRSVETINQKYAIYSRSGALINSGSLSALTGVSGGLFGYNLSDPQMMWDAKTQRFYYSTVYFDSLLSDNGLAIGWSKTATPASSNDFCQYAVSFGDELPDYPKLGDSSDFLLYGYNLFGFFGTSYDGSEFITVNKPPAGSACADANAFAVHASGVLSNADGSPAATPVPANLVDDSSGAGHVVANADLSVTPSADFLSLYSVTTGGTDSAGLPVPSISGPTNVPVPSYSMPSSAAQRGALYLLDTLDGRFEAAVAAVDPGHADKLAVWTAHSVFGGAGAEERWYEIDPDTGSLLQSGTASSPSLFIWNGALSPDRANTGTTTAFGDSMAMSVSTSAATAFPAVQFLWKHGSAAQSPLMNLVQTTSANIDYSCTDTGTCRWGDYSGASPDPAATGTVGKVWLANQYNVSTGGKASNTDWRTWVFGVTPG